MSLKGSPIPPNGHPRGSEVLQSPRNSQVVTPSQPRSATTSGEQYIFEVDDRVEYYSMETRRWMPAVIMNVRGNDNDVFDLTLRNGDEEFDVDRNDIRPQSEQLSPRVVKSTPKNTSGMTLHKSARKHRDTPHKNARFTGYDGYDRDGDEIDDNHNDSNLNDDNDKVPIFDIGDNVFCRYLGGDEYLPGIIVNRTKDNANFHIRYENGEEEFPVPRRHLSSQDVGTRARIPGIQRETCNSPEARVLRFVSEDQKSEESLHISSQNKSSSSSAIDANTDNKGDFIHDENNDSDDMNDEYNNYRNDNDGGVMNSIVKKDSISTAKRRLESAESSANDDVGSSDFRCSDEYNNLRKNNKDNYISECNDGTNRKSNLHSVGETVDIAAVVNNSVEKFPAKIEGVNEDGTYTVRYMHDKLRYDDPVDNAELLSSDDRKEETGKNVECAVTANDEIHRTTATNLSVNNDSDKCKIQNENSGVEQPIDNLSLSFPENIRDSTDKSKSLRNPSFSNSPRSTSTGILTNVRRGSRDSMVKNDQLPENEASVQDKKRYRKPQRHVQFSNTTDYQEYDVDNGDRDYVDSHEIKNGCNLTELNSMIDNLCTLNMSSNDDNVQQLLQALVSSAMVTEAAVKASAEASAATAKAIRASAAVSNTISSLIPQQQSEIGNNKTVATQSSDPVGPSLQVVDWKRQYEKRDRMGSCRIPDSIEDISCGDEVTVEGVYRVHRTNTDGSFELVDVYNEQIISNVQLNLCSTESNGNLNNQRDHEGNDYNDKLQPDFSDAGITHSAAYNMEIGTEYGDGNFHIGDRVEVEEYFVRERNNGRKRYSVGYVIDINGNTCTVKYEDNGEIEDYISSDRVRVLQNAGGVGTHCYTSAQLDDVPVFFDAIKNTNDTKNINNGHDNRASRYYNGSNKRYSVNKIYNSSDDESSNYREVSSNPRRGSSKKSFRANSDHDDGMKNGTSTIPMSKPVRRPSSSPRTDSKNFEELFNIYDRLDNVTNFDSGGSKKIASSRYRWIDGKVNTRDSDAKRRSSSYF